MGNLLGFIGTFLFCYIIKILFLKKGSSPTPSGAIVMAIGIFLYSAMQQFPLLYAYGKYFAFLLAAVWALIVVSIVSTLVDYTFQKRHLYDPIQLFAIGTWVAGTSVLGNVIYQFSIDLGFIPYTMGILNILLYIWYMYHCLYGFIHIVRTPAKNKVHGVLLLATVSTQSIVLLLFNIFNRLLSDLGNMLLIGFGIFLYVIAFLLLLRRYVFVRQWQSVDDWANTNCILHGAISITGLAASTTGALPATFIFFLWVWAICFFIFVEAIEIWRGIVRIKHYGVRKAIVNYDVSQWSRNFTFGMLYAFTAHFTFVEGPIFVFIRQVILTCGPWVVLLLLLYEIFLFFKEKGKWEIINRQIMRESE